MVIIFIRLRKSREEDATVRLSAQLYQGTLTAVGVHGELIDWFETICGSSSRMFCISNIVCHILKIVLTKALDKLDLDAVLIYLKSATCCLLMIIAATAVSERDLQLTVDRIAH